MAESEVSALKEEIRNQCLIMQKLYVELEEEREASTTAVNEALSMILRLQVEKATEKMEACQYKRMTEEKMFYAEETLTIFEEQLYQKEAEIAFLKLQIQAYRDTLSSSGVSYPSTSKIKIPRNSSLGRANAFLDSRSFHGIVRTNSSLPSMKSMDLFSEMDNTNTGSPPTTGQFIPRKNDDCTGEMNSKAHQVNSGVVPQKLSSLLKEPDIENHHCYRGQLERNKNLRELSNTRNVKENIRSEFLSTNELQMTTPIDTSNLGEESGSCSWYSAASHGASNHSTIGWMGTKLNSECASSSCSQAENLETSPDFDMFHASYLENESTRNSVPSVSDHAIFEVSEDHNDYSIIVPVKKISLEPILEDKNMLEPPESVQKEDLNHFLKDDEWLKKPITGWSELEQFVYTIKKDLKLFEDDKKCARQEDFNRGKEHLKLFREISEQLNMILSHIRNSKSKKSPPQDELSFVSLMEAMLSFWL